MNDIWNTRFMSMAREVSTWSKDPSSKIGSVAVGDNNRILSMGYNGFPRGIEDTPGRLNDRDIKLSLVVHAEMNCIYNATYSGVSLVGAAMYVYGLPICSDCCKGVIQVGISRVYISQNSLLDCKPFWRDSWKRSTEMFYEANVSIVEI